MNDVTSAIRSLDANADGRRTFAAWMRRQISLSVSAAATIVALVIGLLWVDAALLRYNRRLADALVRANRTLVPVVGMFVPPLLGIDLDGAARTIGYGGDKRDTLVFVFSPDCPASQRAWPHWLELVRAADQSAVRLVFANIGPAAPAAHASRTAASSSGIVIEADAESRLAYNLQLTPQILRITPAGRIADLWVGALDAGKEKRLEQAIGARGPVALPAVNR